MGVVEAFRMVAKWLCIGAGVLVGIGLAPHAAALSDEPKPPAPQRSIFDDGGSSEAGGPPPSPPRQERPAGPAPAADEEPPARVQEPASVAAAPEPVPAQAAQEKALKRVKEVFAEEYGKRSPEDRVALAQGLLAQAADESDEAARYVMLREARDLASGAGDVDTALDAVGVMTASFVVDAVAMKTDVLSAAARKPVTPAQAETIADGLIELSQGALGEADVDRASRLLAQAETVAKKSKDSNLVERVAGRRKVVRDFVAQLGPIPSLLQKLKADPADPAANVALGKLFCVLAEDWDRGLPLLARGDDTELKKLAAADRAAGRDLPAAVQVSLGDDWWEYAERQPAGVLRSQLRARAGHWYQRALADLAGLERTRVEKRIAQLASDEGPDKGNKNSSLIKSILRALPADAVPRAGQTTWDAGRVGRLLTEKTFNTSFTAELKLTSVNGQRINGIDHLSASFESIGPLEVDGIRYTLNVSVDTRQPIPESVRRELTQGRWVRVKSVVRRMTASSTTDGTGLGIRGVTFHVSLANPNFRVLAAEPARPATPAGP